MHASLRLTFVFGMLATSAASIRVVAAEEAAQSPAPASAGALPPYLKDRGTGVATSMFGTYIRGGELLTEVQWHLSKHAFVKLNNGLGLTSKATD
jgi:hypothetical protein